MKRILLLVLFFAVFTVPVFSKTLYVDGQRGDDSVTYSDNSSERPWRTIGRAAWGSTNRTSPNSSQAAQAGDTVIIGAGTYSTTGTGVRYDPAYNPINSGRADAPIVFQADGHVQLTLSSGAGPVIGANGNARRVNYIIWRGFYINEAQAPSLPDMGSVVLLSTTGSAIEDTTIDGNGVGHGEQDNHTGIRLEWANNVILRNNRIHNVRSSTPTSTHHNGAGIMAYHSSGALIENNEVFDTGAGIFIKGGDNRDFTIRYNLVRDNGTGILVMYTSNEGEHRIYQNLAINNSSGIYFAIGSRNASVVNNTIIGPGDGGVVSWNCGDNNNNRALNNIIFSVSVEHVAAGTNCSVTNLPYLDRNIYFGSHERFSVAGVQYRTFSAWRTAVGSGPGRDNGSAVVNPQFVDAANGNFRLLSGSPASIIGLDVLDLTGDGSITTVIPAGAFITGLETIGLGGVQILAAPRPPILERAD